MRLNDISGHYCPSFFNIVLDTNEELPLAVQKYTATFMHEFIHYLQDLTLPYNLRLNFTNLARFLRICESANKNGNINMPFSDWSDNEKVLNEQMNYTFGNGCTETRSGFEDIVLKIEFVEKVTSELIEIQDRKFILYSYNMLFYNSMNMLRTYNLGARDILEYIAYKIEAKHYQASNMPDLPYRSIDLLFEYYGLSYVSDDIRLCIAEFCLYNDNPIRTLFNYFLENEEFKQNIRKLSYDKIYKILLTWEFETTDGVKETLVSKFDRRLQQFVNILSEQYKGLDGIRRWILQVNDYVKNELTGRFIFSEMYRINQHKFEEFIESVISRVGLPLIMNSKMESGSLQSENMDTSQFIQFYVLQEFLNTVVYSSNITVCPVKNFCVANCCEYDGRCSINPQNKSIDGFKCQYIDFLRLYGLSSIEIK